MKGIEQVKLKPGIRLRSTVCATEVIVVVAPDADVEPGCGGRPMEVIERGSAGPGRTDPTLLDPALAGGTALGKRYVAEGFGLELLCTKAGEGSLTVGEQPLVVKNSKPLPSTD